MEEVGAAFRPLVMQSSGPFATRVVALGDFFREVVPVLFEAVAGVQVSFLGAVRDSGEVADAQVDTCRLLAGCGGCLDFVFADEMQFPSSLRLVVDGANLLQVLNRDTRARLVLDEDVLPRFGVFLVIRAFREPDATILRVVFDAVLLPRHRATRVFFVDAATLLVVVVSFAVVGRIRTRVRLPRFVPRVEGFSEFRKNALTGLD